MQLFELVTPGSLGSTAGCGDGGGARKERKGGGGEEDGGRKEGREEKGRREGGEKWRRKEDWRSICRCTRGDYCLYMYIAVD